MIEGFVTHARNNPGAVALEIGSNKYSYGFLFDEARAIAATLQRLRPTQVTQATQAPLTAVFGHRHHEAFAGIAAALMRGGGYVPINPIFPIERSRSMLQRSGADVLIVERHALPMAPELLVGLPPMLVLVPGSERWQDDHALLIQMRVKHTVVFGHDFDAADTWQPITASANSIAYLLFTSGSTGVPKGVMVTRANAEQFLRVMQERYQPTPADKFSQTFDLTFDLSVFDIFMAWNAGACVVCPTAQEKLFPGRYIKDHGITIWFSVPSTGVLMSKLRMLKPDSYPALRWALFCGEALPVEVMQKWVAAAPNAIAENLYGPTELTIACTLYRWHQDSESECENGVVPIGFAYPDMLVRIENEDGSQAHEGQPGELCMTGPQLSLGYLNDVERTGKAFVTRSIGNATLTFYKTGDRVVRRKPDGALQYLGRVDNQIKIQGYRVELGEIEAVLRRVTPTETAIAVGFPKSTAGADGIVAFVGCASSSNGASNGASSDADLEAIRLRACVELAPYMHPSRVIHIETWPLNANGKIDRNALLESLIAGGA